MPFTFLKPPLSKVELYYSTAISAVGADSITCLASNLNEAEKKIRKYFDKSLGKNYNIHELTNVLTANYFDEEQYNISLSVNSIKSDAQLWRYLYNGGFIYYADLVTSPDRFVALQRFKDILKQSHIVFEPTKVVVFEQVNKIDNYNVILKKAV